MIYQFVIIRLIPEFHRCKFHGILWRSGIASLKNRRDFQVNGITQREYPTMRVNNRKRVGGRAAWNGIRRLADRMS